jgi:hypothetical protein
MHFDDPCEHDWNRWFKACTKGSRLYRGEVEPQHAKRVWHDETENKWHRTAKIDEVSDAGLKVEYYDASSH